MTKGCQKKIYYLKNPGSKYFEEAYLVLRPDIAEKRGKTAACDLASEAERIVQEACGGFDIRKYTVSPKIGKAMSFALGAASSSALIGIVALLIGIG